MTEFTISKSSRLGRYYDWICELSPEGMRHYVTRRWENLNLCTFVQRIFWLTVGKFLLWSGLAALICFGLYTMAFVPYWWIKYGFPAEHPPFQFVIGVIFWVGVMFVSAGVAYQMISTSAWWQAREGRKWQMREAKKAEKAVPRQPSLVWVWLKAKKERVCPLIKVVD